MSTPWIIVSRRFLPLIKSWAMTGIIDRTRFRWDKKKRKGWLAGWSSQVPMGGLANCPNDDPAGHPSDAEWWH